MPGSNHGGPGPNARRSHQGPVRRISRYMFSCLSEIRGCGVPEKPSEVSDHRWRKPAGRLPNPRALSWYSCAQPIHRLAATNCRQTANFIDGSAHAPAEGVPSLAKLPRCPQPAWTNHGSNVNAGAIARAQHCRTFARGNRKPALGERRLRAGFRRSRRHRVGSADRLDLPWALPEFPPRRRCFPQRQCESQQASPEAEPPCQIGLALSINS
jgi:hypothetical protein